MGDTAAGVVVGIQSLPRRPLSLVLSYLTEYEGTTLLLCRRRWTRQMLPLFRLPPSNILDRRHRHRFVVVPVPDATARLDRLNTKRLLQRKRLRARLEADNVTAVRPTTNMTTHEAALVEWTRTLYTLQCQMGRENGCNEGVPQIEHPPLLQFYSSFQHDAVLNDNGGDCPNRLFRPGTTLLASYPRSGNTLLRSLLEAITGFVTGSDTRPDRPLSMALGDRLGLVGEGLVGGATTVGRPDAGDDPSAAGGEVVPIVKTHWPERIGWRRFTAKRVILLVRNPWDAMDSYWHLNATNTHTAKVTDEVYEAHATFFEDMVRNEFRVWRDFLTFYVEQSQRHQVPLLWVRYEDLIHHQYRELERILEFCAKSDWWRHRLDAFSPKEPSNSHAETKQQPRRRSQLGYQSSTSTSSIGRSLKLKRFSPELLEELHDLDDNITEKNHWLKKLGYHIYCQDFPNNLDQLPSVPPSSDVESVGAGNSSMRINEPRPKELRPHDSPFGRKMRDWRRRYTANDTQPFPLVQKETHNKEQS